MTTHSAYPRFSKFSKWLAAFLIATLFSSCYAYKIFPKEYRSYNYSGEKQTAFVINPEMGREYKILQQSGIFIISNDSLAAGTRKIKLHRIEKRLSCGQPIIAGMLTLGQMPVLLPDSYLYSFEEIRNTDTLLKKFDLHVATRYWFWDLFTFNKNFSAKAGKTLLGNYYKVAVASE